MLIPLKSKLIIYSEHRSMMDAGTEYFSDPAAIFNGMLAILKDTTCDSIKIAVATPITKSLMNKYLAAYPADHLENLGVVGGNDGISYWGSTGFGYNGNLGIVADGSVSDSNDTKGTGNPKEVNIHGKINSELDEVDLINKIIYEDKNASKLYMENPDFPQTEAQWAKKQIFDRGSNRINALQQNEFKLSGPDASKVT